MGMEEVINYLKQLEEENKKLKEQNEKSFQKGYDAGREEYQVDKEFVNELEEKLTTLQNQYDMAIQIDNKEIASLKEENKELKEDNDEWMKKFTEFSVKQKEIEFKELKEQNECLQRQIESVCKANDKLKENYQKNIEASEILEEDGKEWNGNEWVDEELEHYKESDIDYYIDSGRKVVLKDGRTLKTNDDWLDESDSDDEEELSKYEKEGSDWAWGYGFTTNNGEYRICMAGGGDHWEDYVITKNRCFIHNKSGKKNVKTFISCPEGNYLKVVHIGETYEPEEGETDMKEMVEENYEEEIMNYDEEYEEPDSP